MELTVSQFELSHVLDKFAFLPGTFLVVFTASLLIVRLALMCNFKWFHGQTVNEDLISMRRYRVCGLLGMASLGHSAGFPRSSRRSTCNLKDNFA